MVEFAVEPAVTDRYDGNALIQKSGATTFTVTFAVWVREPLVPVTTIVYFPAAALDGTVTDSCDQL
jgi:hypothetical protein